MYQTFLSLSLISFLVGATPETMIRDDDPPLPGKNKDSDPPLPAKKKVVTRVKVTAESAEIMSGDEVIAVSKQGTLLDYIKKNDEHFLVLVNGKRGWIKQTDAKLVTIEENMAERANSKSSDSGKQTSPDGSIEITVKDGRISGYNKESEARWLMPAEDKDPYKLLSVKFASKGSRAVKSYGPTLFIVTNKEVICAEASKGKLLWSRRLVHTEDNIEAAELSFEEDAIIIRYNKIIQKLKDNDGGEISTTRSDE